MLPKKFRIARDEFKSLKNRVKIADSQSVFLSIYKNNENTSKFAFSCSKKVSNKAITRNLLRRRGYNYINKNLNVFPKGYYFVFSFKKIPKSYKELEDDMFKILLITKFVEI